MMMKNVKDEGKQMSPLFPRLHVNDGEKGGPRAPPRNKMALYEQLSIPLQRFGSASAPAMPAALKDGSSLASSAPPIFGAVHQSDLLTPSHSSHMKYLSGKAEFTGLGIKLTQIQEKTAIISQSRTASRPQSSTAHSNSTQPEIIRVTKIQCSRKQRGEDNNGVPALTKLLSTTRCDHGNDKSFEPMPGFHLGSSSQRQSSIRERTEPVRSTETESGQNARDPSSKDPEMRSEGFGRGDGPDPVLSVRVTFNASSSPSENDNGCKLQKRPRESVTLDSRSHSSGMSVKFPGIKRPIHNNCFVQLGETSVRGVAFEESAEATGNGDASKSRSKSSLKPFSENKTNHNLLEDNSEYNEDRERDVQAAKDCFFPDTIIEESASAIGILPDDVVGVIGEKLFWKTRRAIINQQRLFGVQVFELHRLMKVQRLLSRSPDLLEGSGLCIVKPSTEVCQTREVTSERPLGSTRKNQTNGNSQEKNLMTKIPLPPVNNEIKRELVATRLDQRASSYPLCYPGAGNQWLVPVMSPSEGLVYNPYTSPCPPSRGELMATMYGGCGPMSLAPSLGDPTAAFGTPASNQQGISVGHSYFLPIGLPMMNPRDNQFSVEELNFSQFRPPSSRNVSTQVSQAVSVSQDRRKSQTLADSEVQGSTGSSPMDPSKGTSMHLLFPMEPASDRVAKTCSGDQQRRIIKVVPCNPRSASESAARIFRSIQEERARHD